MGERICTVDGCEQKHQARGLCKLHWQRWRRHGDPAVVLQIKGDPGRRFWAAVDKSGPTPSERPDLGPCWIWTRPLDKRGYGRMYVSGRHWLPHRWAYETFVDHVPDELDIDHLCRNPGCVNFTGHLEPVTHRENTLRGKTVAAVNAAKTHCPQGHPYSGENLVTEQRRGRTVRICKTCRQARQRRMNARRRR